MERVSTCLNGDSRTDEAFNRDRTAFGSTRAINRFGICWTLSCRAKS